MEMGDSRSFVSFKQKFIYKLMGNSHRPSCIRVKLLCTRYTVYTCITTISNVLFPFTHQYFVNNELNRLRVLGPD